MNDIPYSSLLFAATTLPTAASEIPTEQLLALLRAAPLLLLAASYQPRPQPIQTQGVVLSQTPEAIDIETPQGKITVKTAEPLPPLPPKTAVVIEIYQEKSQNLANLFLVPVKTKTEAPLPAPSPHHPLPLAIPPLKAGDTILALRLSPPPAVPTRAPHVATPPETVFQTLQTSPNVLKEFTQKNPAFGFLLRAPDLKEALRALSAPQLTVLKNFLSEKAAPANIAPAPPSETPIETLLATLTKIIPSALLPQSHLPRAMAPLPLLPQPQRQEPTLALLKTLIGQAVPQEFHTIKIIQVQTAETPLPSNDTLKTALVESETQEGRLVIKADNQHFITKEPLKAPAGTRLIVEIKPATPEQAVTLLSSPTEKDFQPLQDFEWPALEETIETLAQTHPALAQAIKAALPAPNQKMPPATLFFMAALKMGMIEAWLGDPALKALAETGKGNLAKRLGADFARISGAAGEENAEGFRAISLPFLHDEQLTQIQFFIRHSHDHPSSGNDDAPRKITRFLLNLHLSRMGDMQLDGFLQGKTFDMILRSEEKLPFDMRQELMRRFGAGLEQVRMEGSLRFQTRQDAWMTMTPPPQKGLSA